MKQPDEAKTKTGAPEAETSLPDAATDAVSGGSRPFFPTPAIRTGPGKESAK